ncbi:MAG TPA: hypothetical protein VIF62_11315 [Labilithrix sp.]
MRSSSLGLLGVIGIASLSACSVSSTANSLTIKTQKEFVDSNTVTLTSATAWAGEPIKIENDSVDFVNGTGGVQVQVDPSATKITATATFTARADDDAHESEAQQSIVDAKQTFAVDGFSFVCHHGQTHGTSGAGSSGCKLIVLTVPPGTAAQALDLTVGDGNGGISFSDKVLAKNLLVQENGTGDLDVKVDPQKGSTISITGGFDVTVGVPSTFAADSVTLTGPNDPMDIDTSAFQGLASGKGYGTAGTGASSFSVTTGGIGTIKFVQL